MSATGMLRRFAATACLAVLVALPAAAAGLATVRAPARGSEIVITADPRFAGAVSSVIYRDVEYIDVKDHGRQMQSAASFDGLGECFNPTEAGSRDDRGQTSSRLIQLRSGARWIESETDMAFWLPPGAGYGKACGLRKDVQGAVNKSVRAGYRLKKRVSFVDGIPNLILYEAGFVVPRRHKSASVEVVTGYMPKRFSRAWLLDTATGQRSPAQLQGPHVKPVILATEDGHHAMGVWAQGAKPGARAYARFEFPDVNKWSCVRQARDIAAGDTLQYRCYVAVGSLQEVTDALRTAARRF